jgi:hypothetical protein
MLLSMRTEKEITDWLNTLNEELARGDRNRKDYEYLAFIAFLQGQIIASHGYLKSQGHRLSALPPAFAAIP